jgi:hypothetical protein
MLKQAPQKRTVVTVDDRRAVLVMASARKPKDVNEVPHEAFIRNALKDRLGWPRREPAPQQLKESAKHLADGLVKRDRERWAAEAKAKAEREAKEAEQIAKMAADQERWEKQEQAEAEARIKAQLEADTQAIIDEVCGE